MLKLIHFRLNDLTLSLLPPEPSTFSNRPCVARSSSSMWSPQPWRGSTRCSQPKASSALPSPTESALAKTLSIRGTGRVWWGHWSPGLDHNQASTTSRFYCLLVFVVFFVLLCFSLQLNGSTGFENQIKARHTEPLIERKPFCPTSWLEK